MPTCPYCQQITVTRDGHDRHRRQRFTCAGCGRDFTKIVENRDYWNMADLLMQIGVTPNQA